MNYRRIRTLHEESRTARSIAIAALKIAEANHMFVGFNLQFLNGVSVEDVTDARRINRQYAPHELATNADALLHDLQQKAFTNGGHL